MPTTRLHLNISQLFVQIFFKPSAPHLAPSTVHMCITPIFDTEILICMRFVHHLTCEVQNPKDHFAHTYCHKVSAAKCLDILSSCLVASQSVKHSLLVDCLVCLQDRLVQWEFLKSWSPEAHRSYPAKFKDIAKLLLLASVQSISKGSPRQSGVTQ